MTNHPLAYATFHVMGDAVVPMFWTEYFGLSPDTAIAKGEPFVTPSGRLAGPGRVGLWGSSSKRFIHSNDLTPHLRFLVQRLNLARVDLPQVVAEKEVKLRFFCYWNTRSGDRVTDIPQDIRTMMEALGGTIEIDEYRD
ncbi:DUF4279 domain-containing protein [Paraburkholderia sp. Ac-20336]|uniref:DUF4279 domain-containing protein n=1 Tax=Burkholderiaceae TaxID=119060 RepID=UPI001422FFFE|nr:MULTISPECIES: DUF4279 domain-containing protein [Burkholderiaceae]MBN3803428.1 DUF4279 domain-containing protein [Paraburkholderia sp. Ac-20336]MBN3845789.1 DUF4279 domain-containing protein [Paraburkholderia sp. Ac-20342]NIF51656.1 DUF4279 domain-containing protein [Burkholderia sp. Ax-1724]